MSNENCDVNRGTKVKLVLKNNGIYIGFFLIFILFSLSSPYFFDINNIKNIIVQSSIIAGNRDRTHDGNPHRRN